MFGAGDFRIRCAGSASLYRFLFLDRGLTGRSVATKPARRGAAKHTEFDPIALLPVGRRSDAATDDHIVRLVDVVCYCIG